MPYRRYVIVVLVVLAVVGFAAARLVEEDEPRRDALEALREMLGRGEHIVVEPSMQIELDKRPAAPWN